MDNINGSNERLACDLRHIGQRFLVGFENTKVDEDIQKLIAHWKIGNIILYRRNMEDAMQTAKLIWRLQTIAYESGHEVPLAIGIDQEGGMFNNLTDTQNITRFPGAMALAATRNWHYAEQVALATGNELRSIGIWWNFAPILDVLSDPQSTQMGSRVTSDNPIEASKYAIATLKGNKASNVSCCGKHFPGYGAMHTDKKRLASAVLETSDELRQINFVPFRAAIKEGIDSILVGGCMVPKVLEDGQLAYLSKYMVTDLLRGELGFNGIVVSDCIGLVSPIDSFTLKQLVLLAMHAGCDIVMVCSILSEQVNAISGIQEAIMTQSISMDALLKSYDRILAWKRKYVNWNNVLTPPSSVLLQSYKASNALLAQTVSDSCITIVRDSQKLIPLSRHLSPSSIVLLLTPLAVFPTQPIDPVSRNIDLFEPELTFRSLGIAMAACHPAIEHASYSHHGLNEMHEALIEKADAVIIVTVNLSNNLYQRGITKHVQSLCSIQKLFVAVSVSSPYDLLNDFKSKKLPTIFLNCDTI